MFRQLFLVFLLLGVASIQAQEAPNDHPNVKKGSGKGAKKAPPRLKIQDTNFLTLSGGPPLVIARGGFSGVFPESTSEAYKLAIDTSDPSSVMYCNLQITKDNWGICVSELLMDHATDVPKRFPDGEKTYNVNGQNLHGWFAKDFMFDILKRDTHYIQNTLTRSDVFDGSSVIFGPDDFESLEVSRFWINVDYDMFYAQHKLSPASYILDSAQYWTPSHISSTEIGFLKFMSGKVDKTKTKLIFKFLGKDQVEPTTKEKYGSILDKLATLKPFVSGILVPKDYVIPYTKDLYLEPQTTLVTDAHKLGLEVYAYDFLNDVMTSYNYSYDPVKEYLQFVDNPHFAVDGVLTDFPSTASNAIVCFAKSGNLTTRVVNKLIITHDGASGDFPGCTDLAYQKAVDDGADLIDCSVQMSKDGVAFCLSVIDLSSTTTALTTFMDRAVIVPEIQSQSGIFAFDLTWSEIESLKPTISIPWKDSGLVRNPRSKNAGKFVTLEAFLELAKTKKTAGILINIENAAFLASKKGLGLVDAVTTALTNVSFDKQSTQRVMIQSDDSSVLAEFKKFPTYERVLRIKEVIGGVSKEVVAEIKKNADAVTVERETVLPKNSGLFTAPATNVVDQMHAANISVYVTTFLNEYLFMSFDLLTDPYTTLATFNSLDVDGFVTEYPATVHAYMMNPCADVNDPHYEIHIIPAEPGGMSPILSPEALPPALPPTPPLDNADVVDPPLPPVAKLAVENNGTASGPTSEAADSAPKDEKSSAPKNVGGLDIISMAVALLFGLLSLV